VGTNATVRAQSPDNRYGGTAVNAISPGPQPYAVNQPTSQSGSVTPAQFAAPGDPLANPNVPGSGGTVPRDFGSDPGILPPPGGFSPGADSPPPISSWAWPTGCAKKA